MPLFQFFLFYRAYSDSAVAKRELNLLLSRTFKNGRYQYRYRQAVLRIRIPFMWIRILPFNLMRNRILPLTFFQIWTLQNLQNDPPMLQNNLSKASPFLICCGSGSGSCFSLWSGSSFPLWRGSGSSFPQLCGSMPIRNRNSAGKGHQYFCKLGWCLILHPSHRWWVIKNSWSDTPETAVKMWNAGDNICETWRTSRQVRERKSTYLISAAQTVVNLKKEVTWPEGVCLIKSSSLNFSWMKKDCYTYKVHKNARINIRN